MCVRVLVRLRARVRVCVRVRVRLRARARVRVRARARVSVRVRVRVRVRGGCLHARRGAGMPLQRRTCMAVGDTKRVQSNTEKGAIELERGKNGGIEHRDACTVYTHTCAKRRWVDKKVTLRTFYSARQTSCF